MRINIAEYLSSYSHLPIIDVRSPAEFAQGHIPEALSLPLFSDDERAQVGTLYKQQSRESAIIKGLELVGPKMKSIAEFALQHQQNNQLIVHCWRGGMRSESVSWLISKLGIQVFTIEGGYKEFRKFVLNYFETPFNIRVLGGYTGSGKSKLLHHLTTLGEKIIDLESLAHHKGSAFGNIPNLPQPSQEQFENNLFAQLWKLGSNHFWVEDESITIGKRVIPSGLWHQMRNAPVYFINKTSEERIPALVQEYAQLPKEQLIEAIRRITKKLGFDQAKFAIEFIENNIYEAAAQIILNYYDKTYNQGLSKRDPNKIIKISESNFLNIFNYEHQS